MNAKELKRYLLENPKLIEKILKHFKFHSIINTGENIFCGKPNGGSKKSVSVKLDNNLTSSSFSMGISGDFFNLIAKTHNISWSDVIYTIQLIIDKKNIDKLSKPYIIFDGILDNIYIPKKTNKKIYNDYELNKYTKIWNYKFVKDYIYPKTQFEFEIGYDEREKRISIPWRNDNGDLIGVIGRANFETDLRYFPLLNFPKSYYLYGLWKTKEYIKKTKTAYIGESEKFVMQLWGYGYKNSVAIGCSTISKYQVQLLLKYNCKEFVLCFDEGTSKDTIKKNINTIKECLFMQDNCKITIIFDKNNEVLDLNSKESPSDLGKDKWIKLINTFSRSIDIK